MVAPRTPRARLATAPAAMSVGHRPSAKSRSRAVTSLERPRSGSLSVPACAHPSNSVLEVQRLIKEAIRLETEAKLAREKADVLRQRFKDAIGTIETMQKCDDEQLLQLLKDATPERKHPTPSAKARPMKEQPWKSTSRSSFFASKPILDKADTGGKPPLPIKRKDGERDMVKDSARPAMAVAEVTHCLEVATRYETQAILLRQQAEGMRRELERAHDEIFNLQEVDKAKLELPNMPGRRSASAISMIRSARDSLAVKSLASEPFELAEPSSPSTPESPVVARTSHAASEAASDARHSSPSWRRSSPHFPAEQAFAPHALSEFFAGKSRVQSPAAPVKSPATPTSSEVLAGQQAAAAFSPRPANATRTESRLEPTSGSITSEESVEAACHEGEAGQTPAVVEESEDVEGTMAIVAEAAAAFISAAAKPDGLDGESLKASRRRGCSLRDQAAMRIELASLRTPALRRRARTAGVTVEILEQFAEGFLPRRDLVHLVFDLERQQVAAMVIQDSFRRFRCRPRPAVTLSSPRPRNQTKPTMETPRFGGQVTRAVESRSKSPKVLTGWAATDCELNQMLSWEGLVRSVGSAAAAVPKLPGDPYSPVRSLRDPGALLGSPPRGLPARAPGSPPARPGFPAADLPPAERSPRAWAAAVAEHDGLLGRSPRNNYFNGLENSEGAYPSPFDDAAQSFRGLIAESNWRYKWLSRA